MRFMILLKAMGECPAPIPDRAALLADFSRYNDRLARAGVLLAADGLHPLTDGMRLNFSGEHRALIADHLPEPREVLANYWLLQVRSKEEAVEWVKRLPHPLGAEGVIELRRAVEPTNPARFEG